jgi:hypothetical protein
LFPFTNGVIDSNGNFATSVKIAIGINDTSGTTVVHLDLQISQLIKKKYWNDPNVIFRGLGKDELWKKTKKHLVTLSL